ncbi:Ig-like domain-containing protein [Shewanella corallii]|uniref:Ig-like domain-containing protein n=1 Tax=Shewanella corallii TaxID=560080 RepID=A0ABT0NBN0_9GAMM|nr:Ig-like domain-containing protein [Shewanella corallii]MCL2915882.1 Ig-like domain-containing protein [Shewanella corallii]
MTLTGCLDSNESPEVSSNAPQTIDERTNTTLSVNAQDSDGGIVKYTWVQTAGPDISFIQDSASISFEVPEVTATTLLSFDVTVEDNDGATASTEVSTNIQHINRLPTADDLSFEVEFNNSLQFDLVATDPDGDELSGALAVEASNGQIEAIDGQPLSFTYLTNKDAIDSETLVFTITDQEDEIQINVDIKIIDTSAPVITGVSPADKATRVALTPAITLTFDDIMQAPQTASSQTCAGGIQLSADNFASCIEAELTSADNKTWTLTPKTSLMADTDYQLKTTGAVSNFHGTAMDTDSITTFTTEAVDLIITEVSASKYGSDNRWIELYNGTNRSVSLADYAVKAETFDLDAWAESGVQTFSLSDKTLAPGEYMVIQGRFGNGYWQSNVADSEQLILIGEASDNVRPLWYESGFVELLTANGNQTVDFVRFGESTDEPTSAGFWTDGSAPVLETQLGMSIVRDQSVRDSDSGNDWSTAFYMTPGGINDVSSCRDDLDEDGIPDCAEQPGTTFAGLPLYDWGARENVKDIFIEVDYMESDDPGITPHQRSLERVQEVFEARGYQVHFDVGDLYDQADGISPANMDLGGGNQVPFYQQTLFTSSAEAPSIGDHKVQHSDLRRKPIFHYMLMANSQQVDGAAGSSGYAEIYGNDFFISMGNWGFSLETEASRNTVINMQASTILHELGHNLGLYHGGEDGFNNKPNYLSSMNYLYQLQGLPSIGNREGDRYYRRFFYDNLNCNQAENTLVNGFDVAPEEFAMDYSDGLSMTLNENTLDETQGFGHTESGSVDFNCDGSYDNLVGPMDINGDGSIDELRDYNEWAILDLQFNRTWSGNVGGNEQRQRPRQETNVMNSDQQETISEPAPSQVLLDKIRGLNHD